MLGRRLAFRSTTRRGLVLGASLAALGAVGAGCGGAYSDLLAVQRTGSLPDAKVGFVINDGGTIRCDGGREQPLPSKLLLEARDVVRALREQFEAGHDFPRSPQALLRFRAETADGDLAFGDTDGARDPDVGRLVLLVRRTAQQMCGSAR